MTQYPRLCQVGVKDKAPIDELNAVSLSTKSVNGGMFGHDMNEVSPLSGEKSNTYLYYNNYLEFGNLLQNAFLNLQGSSQQLTEGNKVYKAVQSGEYSELGTCGGQLNGFLNVDDATGEFWGDMIFIDYCESDNTQNGELKVSGKIDLSTEEPEYITFEFKYFEIMREFDSSAFAGTVTITYNNSSTTFTMDMLIKDDMTEEVYWIRDFTVEEIESIDSKSIDISGKFYDPSYGYIIVSTQEKLK